MKDAQSHERQSSRTQSREREPSASEGTAPKPRVKAERKPAAGPDAAQDNPGTNPPPDGKGLPPLAAIAAVIPALPASAARPEESVPAAVGALATSVTSAAPPVPPGPVQKNADAAPSESPTAADDAPAAPSADFALTADAAPAAPATAPERPMPAEVSARARQPLAQAPTDARLIPQAPTPTLIPAAAASATDPLPTTPAPAVMSAPPAADPAAADKYKMNAPPAANPPTGGSADGPSAQVAAQAAAQALTSGAVRPSGAIISASDRDASARSTDLVRTPSAPGADGVSIAAATNSVLAPSTAAASGAAGPAVFKLHQGLDTPEFSQALADKVAWLVDKDIGSAKLQINPPQLGPIDVHIEVQGDKAQVWLSAHSVVTRDALEAAAPRLRDMLGSQGFAQVSVDVSQRSFQDRTAPPPVPWLPAASNGSPEALFSADTVQPKRVSMGALDAYA